MDRELDKDNEKEFYPGAGEQFRTHLLIVIAHWIDKIIAQLF